jgi:hypothetical protein
MQSRPYQMYEFDPAGPRKSEGRASKSEHDAGFKEGHAAGLAEGHAAGLIEGRAVGALEAQIASLFEIYDARKRSIPDAMAATIRASKNPEEITEWIRRAALVEDPTKLFERDPNPKK